MSHMKAAKLPEECEHVTGALYLSQGMRGARVECRDCGISAPVLPTFIRDMKKEDGGCFEQGNARDHWVLLVQAKKVRAEIAKAVRRRGCKRCFGDGVVFKGVKLVDCPECSGGEV